MEHLINKITPGDARELAKQIPDESCNLVFCDPVYENVDDYRWLGETAMRVLKQDSALLAWCSKRLAARCQLAIEESGLDYIYTLDYVVTAKTFRLQYYHLFLWTTPCLLFQKGHALPNKWLPDTYISQTPPDHEFKWNKNLGVVQKWLTAYSKPGDLVFDPFAGSGTVPVVAKQTSRNFVGFEINETRAIEAQYRVETAPIPLFLLDETENQLSLDEMVG